MFDDFLLSFPVVSDVCVDRDVLSLNIFELCFFVGRRISVYMYVFTQPTQLVNYQYDWEGDVRPSIEVTICNLLWCKGYIKGTASLICKWEN